MPIAYEFNPQLVIGISPKTTTDSVSAGFDAAAGDPIGGCEVTPAGYAHMTHMLMPLAEGKLVLTLEGGYNLESTAKSALACVRVLMGEPPGPLDPWRTYPSEATVRVVNKVLAVQSIPCSPLEPSLHSGMYARDPMDQVVHPLILSHKLVPISPLIPDYILPQVSGRVSLQPGA